MYRDRIFKPPPPLGTLLLLPYGENLDSYQDQLSGSIETKVSCHWLVISNWERTAAAEHTGRSSGSVRYSLSEFIRVVGRNPARELTMQPLGPPVPRWIRVLRVGDFRQLRQVSKRILEP
jgi:hypothetical protein